MGGICSGRDISFISQGPLLPYDSLYVHNVPKTAVVTAYKVIPVKQLDKEGEFPTSPPFPGKRQSIGAELHYKTFNSLQNIKKMLFVSWQFCKGQTNKFKSL